MEFVVVGWTDPAGSPSHIGALLLGYYTEDGRLHYAGRAGTGMNDREHATTEVLDDRRAGTAVARHSPAHRAA